MPLESATHISDLVTSNPAASDGMNNADDHMRMIKAVLKNDFPNISGAITATHTQVNTAVDAVVTTGVGKFADAGVFFKTSGDGFKNSLAGDIDVWLGGVTALTMQRTGGVNFLKVFGAIQADSTITSGAITAPGITPIGGMIMWLSDTLPPTTEGVWCWANGQAVSRSTYSTAFARLGTTHGAGDGSTTFNVIDMQSVVPVGKNTMGGAAGNSILSTISNALKNALGAFFGTEVETLTTTQIPAHFHGAGIYDPGHTHSHNLAALAASSTGGGQFQINAYSAGTINAAVTGVRVNSANGLDTTASAGGGAAHNNVGPRRTVNFIVRLA
jgi:microcystin-dependent protein